MIVEKGGVVVISRIPTKFELYTLLFVLCFLNNICNGSSVVGGGPNTTGE